MCIAILDVVVCDIIFHKFFKRKKKNKMRFYVARDKDRTLYLYLGKPTRKENEFSTCSLHSCAVCSSCFFEDLGLNADDYKDLRWEDEPIEVFLNLED